MRCSTYREADAVPGVPRFLDNTSFFSMDWGMAIFAVIKQPNTTNRRALEDAIHERFPDKSYLIATGVWLVSAPVTARTLSDQLGVTGETDTPTAGAVVLEVASYFGKANPEIWSWIKNNWDADLDG